MNQLASPVTEAGERSGGSELSKGGLPRE